MQFGWQDILHTLIFAGKNMYISQQHFITIIHYYIMKEIIIDKYPIKVLIPIDVLKKIPEGHPVRKEVFSNLAFGESAFFKGETYNGDWRALGIEIIWTPEGRVIICENEADKKLAMQMIEILNAAVKNT